MKSLNFVAAGLLAVLAFPQNVQGQGFEALLEDESRKKFEISRTELSPKLDGILDDEIWKHATVLSDMHQLQPVDHGIPSERSEFYITYNDDYLYVAARLYDSSPSEISARQLVQGSNLGFDDSFKFVLDTFSNGRTGYQFQVNPNGIRREGVYEGPMSLNRDWSGIWLVESRIDELGWVAEVAIPFKTLNFDPGSEEWGFSIGRSIARKQEDIAWASFNRNLNPSTAGIMTGIHDIKQGKGLDIIPSITAASSENYITGITETRVDPSVDIFYKFTSNLTGALTINTDFSATEVDSRQVNLSRFSLFFPEKRDFFLQDVDIFGFGGIGQGFSFNANGIPFYSRRIGLSAMGEPVDINAGVKLTGRVGDFNVGALVVQQGEHNLLGKQNLIVARASANILSESTVGAIFTEGDPTSDRDNSLVGVDFHYQNTRFTDTHSLISDSWYQQTETPGKDGDDKAFGTDIHYETQNNGFGGFASYNYFGEDYNPALGFANRRGVETFETGGSGRYYLKNHSTIRNIFSFMRFSQTRKLDTKELQSETIFWNAFNANTHRGDQFGFGVARNREGLERPFMIRPGIVIPAGEYTYSSYMINASLSNQLTFSPTLRYDSGEFYDGDRTQISVGVNWRPDKHFLFKVNYNYQDVELPQGAFISRLISANANYAFNAKWSWINLIQYDNFSNTVGLNSRLRWNPQAGEDLYLVINYNFDSEGAFTELSSRSSEIVLKYTKTFRF